MFCWWINVGRSQSPVSSFSQLEKHENLSFNFFCLFTLPQFRLAMCWNCEIFPACHRRHVRIANEWKKRSKLYEVGRKIIQRDKLITRQVDSRVGACGAADGSNLCQILDISDFPKIPRHKFFQNFYVANIFLAWFFITFSLLGSRKMTKVKN